jgi:sec-independent protein translocase protein TatC
MSSGYFTLSEHFTELRARLKVVLLSLLIILIVLIVFPANPLYSIQNPEQYLNLQFLSNTLTAAFIRAVASYVLPAGWTLIAATGVGEAMEIYFVAALLLALIVDMPIIAYETYKFVDPALNENERKLLYPFVTSTTILFAVGVAFGFFVLSKFLIIALAPFFTATNISFLVDSGAFYYVVFLIIGATGVSFTAPVFVYVLITLKVIDPGFFSKNRLVIWFVIWIVTGLFLTPDGGPLLDLVIFIPIVALVEGAVWLGKRKIHWTPPVRDEPLCEYCSAEVRPGSTFCVSCKRSLR